MKSTNDQPSEDDAPNQTAAFAADSALTAKGSAAGRGKAESMHHARNPAAQADDADAATRLRDLGKQALLEARPNDGQLGEFTLIREIGRGGMGVVYEAMQQSLQRRVALKVLPLGSLMNRHQIHRFQNESRAAAQLHHPNIVPVFSVGSDAGIHYYAMQYIDGNNLARVIAEIRRDVAQSSGPSGRGILPAAAAETATEERTQSEPRKQRTKQRSVDSESSGSKRSGLSADEYIRATSSRRTPQVSAFFQAVARIGIQAAEALGHAHELSIVHRDVKPSNLMLDPSGKLWVTDFGLAQIRNAASMTKTGDLVGTLRYMSPEQASGRRAFLDHRTDIYSLGATLYELLTLRPVAPGKEFEEIFRQISFGRPAPLRRVNPRIPEELETIVSKALERDPSDRYQTAAELAEDLRRFAADEPILARPPTMLKRYRRWMQRHRAFSAGLAAALAIILVVSLGASAVAWNALQLEKVERQRAEVALDKSEGSRLLTQAALLQPTDPGLALALAVRGAELHPGPEANSALIAAMDANHEIAAVTPRQDNSPSLVISPDGRVAVTCVSSSEFGKKRNAPAIVHETPTGKRLAELGTGSPITSAVFDPTGRTVLTTSAPAPHRRAAADQEQPLSEPPTLWDAQNWQPRFAFDQATLPEAHEGVFSADGTTLVLCGPGAAATLFDVSTGVPTVRLQGHDSRVIFAGFSPDGRRIATVTEAGTVSVFSAEGGAARWTFAVREGHAWKAEVDFTSDSAQLAVTDGSGTRFFPLSTGDEPPGAHFYYAHSISVSRSGPYAVTASGLRLAVIDTRLHEVVDVVQLEGPPRQVIRPELRSDGRQLLVANGEMLYLYAIPSGRLLARLAGHTAPILNFRFIPGGDLVASVAADKTLRFWHAQSGFERRRFPGRISPSTPTLIAFSGSGQLMASASSEDWFTIGRSISGDAIEDRWPGQFEDDRRGPPTLVTWDNETIYVWDTATARRSATLSRVGQGIQQAMAVPGGPWVVYITDESAAALWNTVSERIVPITSDAERALSMDAAPDGRRLAVGLSSGQCRVIEMADELTVTDLTHDFRVADVCFSEDSAKLLTVDNGNTIRIWVGRESTPAVTIAAPKRNNTGRARFAGNDRYVVSYHDSGNEVVHCWNAETGELHSELAASGTVTVSPHAVEPIVSVVSDEGLRLWNLDNDDVSLLTEDPIRAARLVGDSVAAISLVPQVRLGRVAPLAMPEGVGKLRLWSITDGELLREEAVGFEPRDLSVMESSQRLIIGGRVHNAIVNRMTADEPLLRVGDHAAAITFVGFGRDDESIITASADGTAKIHDLQGRLLSTLVADRQPISAAAISPDRQLLVTGDHTGALVMWDLGQAAEARRLIGHSAGIQSVAFDAAGHQLLTTSLDASVRLWDLRTGRSRTFTVEPGVFSAELTADGKTLLIVPGQDLVLWHDAQQRNPKSRQLQKSETAADAILIDLGSGKRTEVDQEGITTLARFSPDGRQLGLLANVQGEFFVDVYEFPSLQRVRRIDPVSRVTVFAFDDDASHLLTRQDDGLTLWDLGTGRQQLDVPQRAIGIVAPWHLRDWNAFSPDGRWILTPDADQRITRWPVDVLEEARRAMPRPLTDQQRRQFRLEDAQPAGAAQ